jgi:hypothetical protein
MKRMLPIACLCLAPMFANSATAESIPHEIKNNPAVVGQDWKPVAAITLKYDAHHEGYRCCVMNGSCNWQFGKNSTKVPAVVQNVQQPDISGQAQSPAWIYDIGMTNELNGIVFQRPMQYQLHLFLQCKVQDVGKGPNGVLVPTWTDILLDFPFTIDVVAPPPTAHVPNDRRDLAYCPPPTGCWGGSPRECEAEMTRQTHEYAECQRRNGYGRGVRQ